MKEDVFDRYEQLPVSYHEDPLWKLVDQFRRDGKHPEANGLVFQIRRDYGFDG